MMAPHEDEGEADLSEDEEDIARGITGMVFDGYTREAILEYVTQCLDASFSCFPQFKAKHDL